MQRKSRVISFNLKYFASYLPFIIFVAVYLIGVLIGNLVVGNVAFVKDYASEAFDSFYQIRRECVWYDVLRDSAFNILPVFVLVFVLGTSVIGCVCSPAILLGLGVRNGLITGYLYFTYKLEGIMFNCLILLPSILIMLFGVVLLSLEAFNFSCIISKVCIKSEMSANVYMHFKSYCVKSGTTLIVAAISIICDVLLSNLFISFFAF